MSDKLDGHAIEATLVAELERRPGLHGVPLVRREGLALLRSFPWDGDVWQAALEVAPGVLVPVRIPARPTLAEVLAVIDQAEREVVAERGRR